MRLQSLSPFFLSLSSSFPPPPLPLPAVTQVGQIVGRTDAGPPYRRHIKQGGGAHSSPSASGGGHATSKYGAPATSATKYKQQHNCRKRQRFGFFFPCLPSAINSLRNFMRQKGEEIHSGIPVACGMLLQRCCRNVKRKIRGRWGRCILYGTSIFIFPCFDVLMLYRHHAHDFLV